MGREGCLLYQQCWPGYLLPPTLIPKPKTLSPGFLRRGMAHMSLSGKGAYPRCNQATIPWEAQPLGTYRHLPVWTVAACSRA